eukprot:2769171-Amphidinium_carterae.2
MGWEMMPESRVVWLWYLFWFPGEGRRRPQHTFNGGRKENKLLITVFVLGCQSEQLLTELMP